MTMIEPTHCAKCGAKAPVHWHCDQDGDGGPYCDDCFAKHDCRDNHEEGCATKVFECEDPEEAKREPWQERAQWCGYTNTGICQANVAKACKWPYCTHEVRGRRHATL